MCVQLLNVDSMLHLQTLNLARCIELLATAKLLYDTGLVKFTFEFLDSAMVLGKKSSLLAGGTGPTAATSQMIVGLSGCACQLGLMK